MLFLFFFIFQRMMNEIRELCLHDRHLDSVLLHKLIIEFPDLNDFFSLYNFDRILAREQGRYFLPDILFFISSL
jgi:hypothetical protein